MQKVDEYQQKREELIMSFAAIKKEYIESNKPFKIGTKVKVTTDTRGKVVYGYVDGYDLSLYSATLTPTIKQCKKDGTPHATKHIFFPYDAVIEPC